MLLRFKLPFQLPGLNDLLDHKSRTYRTSSKFGSHSVQNAYNDMKARYSKDIAIMVRHAHGTAIPKIPQRSVRCIEFLWREPDNRRDPDNIAAAGTKLIMDSLQAMGVIATDGWSLFLHDDFTRLEDKYPLFKHCYLVDPKNVGVEVQIDYQSVSAS